MSGSIATVRASSARLRRKDLSLALLSFSMRVGIGGSHSGRFNAPRIEHDRSTNNLIRCHRKMKGGIMKAIGFGKLFYLLPKERIRSRNGEFQRQSGPSVPRRRRA